MSYDVAAVRAHFPALKQGAAHFDGPGGSQVPDVVGDAVRATLVAPIANRGRVTEAERNADDDRAGRPRGDGRPARRRPAAASCSAAA